MTIEEYQEYAKKNWMPGCDDTVFALGLGGETGEVLEVIKKARRKQVPINLGHLAEELGDVLWYVANLCNTYDLSMEKVIENNVNKLDQRYAKGKLTVKNFEPDLPWEENKNE